LPSALRHRAAALVTRSSAVRSRLSSFRRRLSARGSRLSAVGSRLSALGSRLSAFGFRLSGSPLSTLSSLTRHSRWLAGQRALPDAEQQLFELGKTLGSEHRAPFPFDVAEDVVGLCVCGASALGKTDNACAALVGRVGPDEIAATL